MIENTEMSIAICRTISKALAYMWLGFLQRRKNEVGDAFEELMVENTPKQVKGNDPQIQQAQWIPSKIIQWKQDLETL